MAAQSHYLPTLHKLFRTRPVALLSDLRKALQTPSRTTVFRVLSSVGYLTSYSHAGRYYTLKRIPQFDPRGLWHYRQIGFSSQRTLRATLVHLVETSPAGHARADRNHLGPLPSKKNSPRTLQAREALRSVIASLDQRYREQVHEVETVPLIVREPPEACAVCGGRMNVQKTIQRWGKTLAHGLFRVRETIYACASRRKKGHRVVTARSSFLAQLLLPHSTVGYDLLVYVGCQRFVHYRQREEIRSELKERYGIVLSTGEISALGRRFLVYLEALHQKQSPALRAALEADGGCPLHIDATGEDGRGTLVTAWAGWRGWVLSAWKAPTERAEFMLPGIQRAPG